MTLHGIAWRWRRQLMRRRSADGVLWRWAVRFSRRGTAARTASGAVGTLVNASISLEAAEALLRSLRVPTSGFCALPPFPTVGVVVPSYCDSRFLGAALQSITDQTYPHWRCVVVDDASPEDVANVVQPFRLADDRILLARHGGNGGLAAARNTGLRQLDTDMVIFLDADDMLVPTAIEHAVGTFASVWHDPAVAGVHGQVIQVPEEALLADLATWRGMFNRSVVDWTGHDGECPFNVHSVVTRRSLLETCGGFDESLRQGAEDWDLWFRLLRHGYRFAPNGHIMGAYRQRRASMIRNHQSVHLGRAERLYVATEQWARLDPALTVGRGAAAPLSRTRLAHARARRAASVIAMQIASTGSLSALDDSMAFDLLDPDGLAEGRWTEIVESARNGAARGLGVSRATSNGFSTVAQDKILRIGRAVAEEIFARARQSDGESWEYDATTRQTHVDVLLVAESVADVEVLAGIVTKTDHEHRAAAVDLEIIAGDSGANDAWSMSGIDIVPYHQVVGNVGRLTQLVACTPVGPVTADLILAAQRAGVDCRLVPVPGRPVALSGAGGAMLDSIIEPADAVAERIRSVETRQRPRPRLARWRGSDFSRSLPFEDGPLDTNSIERLRGLRDRHRGETAVIIGNGPSLNETELAILTDVPTFGVNAIFLAAERFPRPITYYVVEDTSVFKENLDAIKAFPTDWKLFPAMYRPSFEDEEIDDHTIFFRMNAGFYDRRTGTACHPRFSFDATQRLYCGQSVTIINLQLAHWMGFQRVVLIGMDFSYSIPDDVDRDGALIISRSDDPNHFHPGYFGPGKSWKDPLLDRVRVNYHLADEVYRATGREIINATEGGKLDIFPRMPLREAIDRNT